MNTEHASEKLTAKDFEFVVEEVNREKGHVYLLHGGIIHKWYLHPDGRVMLINGREEDLDAGILDAMKRQVYAILRPELKKRSE